MAKFEALGRGRMKKRIFAVLISVICLLCVTFAPIGANAATKMNLNATYMSINCGSTKAITVKINGKSKSAGSFIWSSNNKNIAAISNTGVITPKKIGSAVITATYKKNKQIHAECTVKVTADYSITPTSNPFKNKYKTYSTYNKYTSQYYMIRSYLEQLESTGGGTLTFKKGTYTVPAVLYVASNITIKLNDGVVIKKSNVTNTTKLLPSCSLFQFVAPSKINTKYTEYNNSKNIKLIGVNNAVIDMTNALKGKKSTSVVMGHNKNITIENINFKNLAYGHFFEMDATRNALIKNCTFENSYSILKSIAEGTANTGGGMINLDTPDKLTKGFTQNWTSYDCTANKDVTFINCSFVNGQYGIETHQYSENHPHENVVITKCKFMNITRYAVQMLNWKNPQLINNKISVVGVGITAPKDNISYGIYCSGVTQPVIKNNVFDTCKTIARFNTSVSKYGYKPIDNNISEEEYREIVSSNYSHNNSNTSRKLIVSQGINEDGTVNFKHVYKDIYFGSQQPASTIK